MSASEQARAAVRAVKNRKRWGVQAAWRYAEKRGVTRLMYLFAMHVETNRELRAKGFNV